MWFWKRNQKTNEIEEKTKEFDCVYCTLSVAPEEEAALSKGMTSIKFHKICRMLYLSAEVDEVANAIYICYCETHNFKKFAEKFEKITFKLEKIKYEKAQKLLKKTFGRRK